MRNESVIINFTIFLILDWTSLSYEELCVNDELDRNVYKISRNGKRVKKLAE